MTTQRQELTNLNVKDASDAGSQRSRVEPRRQDHRVHVRRSGGRRRRATDGLLTYKTGALSLFPRKGYADPSWSPDGSMIAAERVSTNGRDIVILSAKNGAELARLTNDDDSFAPVWSPDGNQIAFLHRHNLGVDLEIMTSTSTPAASRSSTSSRSPRTARSIHRRPPGSSRRISARRCRRRLRTRS